ncbi:MAG TPA: amino acid adenylation domain-containing protein [Blastocatellia bacterium]|nr:amino acid adenylation domain-containing protein [Blastocatellia bacterium]
MSAAGMLSELQRLGVEISAGGGQLRYRAPKGTVTVELRDELAAHKHELLSLLLSREPAFGGPSEGRRYRLSAAQEGLWFMHQLVPDSGLYNESAALRVRGALKIVAMTQALCEVVRRHQALRTAIDTFEGEPYQSVARAVRLCLPLIDLSGLAESDGKEEGQKLAVAQARRPFNLARPPLVNVSVLAHGPVEYVVALSLHHIICDGWSKGILVKELGRLYCSWQRGEQCDLPVQRLQYSDYALWQRRQIDSGELDGEIDYWKNELNDWVQVLELPADRPRGPLTTYRGASVTLRLTSEESRGLKELSRAHGVTQYTTLLAAWQTLLGHYSGQDRLIVGTVAANRAHASFENVIGLVVNTVVIKGDLSGNPSFSEMLVRVRDASIGAFENQELPFEKVVASLALERDASRIPLVEVMLVVEQGLSGQVELSNLTVEEEHVESGLAKYDLMLVLREKDGGFEGRIEFNTDIFDQTRINRMAAHFTGILAAAVSGPDRTIWDLTALGESEAHLLLREWNDTATVYHEYVSDRGAYPAHRMFEEQEKMVPDAVAVANDQGYLTYRELNERANRLSRYLKGRGAGPDVPVGICAGRTFDTLIGILAILKADGAYMPLDPEYPAERLQFMLAEAEVGIVLTERHLASRLPIGNSQFVFLDRDLDWASGCGSENPQRRAAGKNLAYVIHTSGSTGKPKGVCLSHEALTNLLQWRRTGLPARVRSLQFASFTFDVSFYEIFATWALGGTVLIVSQEQRLDIPALGRFLSEHEVEAAVLPVTVLQELAKEHEFCPMRLDAMREITTAGEQLQITPSIIKFFESFQACRLNNHYGPSESHVVTEFPMGPEPWGWNPHPPIGEPIDNCRTYVLDNEFRAMPIGVTGELYIGGAQLARGYLNQTGSTAERFLPDPHGSWPGERIYKTGDLARWREDGQIDYLGRLDHQVKIRGFRVELGEIESILNEHPLVREAVVVTRDDSPGNIRLVAYVARNRGEQVTRNELRAYLKQRLPEHMIPSAFVVMNALPLTPNGKVDRMALTLSSPPVSGEEDFMPARTPAEELVAGVWSQALGVQKVGINSNFFGLGGHSLVATRVILRLREIFRINLPVRAIFAAPTVDGVVNAMSALWGGREIVEEIAWTFQQVEQLPDQQVQSLLAQGEGGMPRSQCG